MRDSFDRAVRDFQRILLDSAAWRLPPAAWREIDETVEQGAQHMRAGDLALLRRTVGTLISMSPGRATKKITGAEEARPAVRERINILIQSIEARPAAQRETDPARPAGDPRHGR